jgi:ArsR family metal-binding transcriptional regulator
MVRQRVTTFPTPDECQKARVRLDRRTVPYEAISAEPGFRYVGAGALAADGEAASVLAAPDRNPVICSGWVDYRPAAMSVPLQEPRAFEEDVFGRAAVTVLAPCVADATKIRLIAHISGDLSKAFPYLNAEMEAASYNRHAPTFTFMDGYRMVNLYPRRITVAKADEIVDAWRVLEMIRCRVNAVWARREEIEPDYEMRQRPPALEVFKRLPGTNCRQCGELTCLAFAVQVNMGQAPLERCKPVFGGEYEHLKAALVEICAGLGV